MKNTKTKILCLMFVVLFIAGSVMPMVGAVSTTTKFASAYVNHAAFGSMGVKLHFADINGDGTCSNSEVVYCLQRGTASGSEVGKVWTGDTSIQMTDLWQSMSRNQRSVVNWVLIHGYPNYTGSYGLSGVSAIEKMYATQILLWEYVEGARSPADFGYTPQTPSDFKAGDGRDFANAFNVQSSVIGSSSYEMTESGGKFADAYAYYKKLVDAVKTHKSLPSYNNKMVWFNSVGKNTITDSLFSEFTFKSTDTSVATVSQSGDNVIIDIKCLGATARIYGIKNVTAKDGKTPVMLQSANGGTQTLIYDHLEDPVNTGFNVSAKNTTLGSIGVMKTTTYGKSVAGAKFGIYSSAADANSGSNLIDTITTEQKGWAIYGGGFPETFSLAAGTTYYLKELADENGKPYGNANLIVDPTVRSVTVQANAWALCAGAVTDEIYYGTESTLKNATYGKIIVQSYSDNTLTGGYTFELYKTESDALARSNKVTSFTTDSSGEYDYCGSGKNLASSNLAAGWYYLRMTGAPDGVTVSSTIYQPYVYANTTTKLSIRSDKSGIAGGVVDANRGSIAVKKADPHGNPLAGAKFGIYSNEADANSGSDLIDTITTDSTGTACYGGSGINDFSLIPGTVYYLREVSAPKGYAVDATVRQVTVASNTVSFASDNFAKLTYFDYGLNAYETNIGGQLKVSATGANYSQKLQNVQFGVYTSLDNVKSNIPTKTLTTGSSGEAYVNIGSGTYFVKMTAKGSFDTLDNTVYTVKVEANTTSELYVGTNSTIINYRCGGLKIAKVDNFGNPVEGCIFEVSTDPSFSVKTALDATDAQGFAYYGYDEMDYTLSPGSIWYIREASCPDKYIKTSDVKTATILTDRFTEPVLFTNTLKGSLQINKTCVDGGGGWEFTITGVAGTETEGQSFTAVTTPGVLDSTKGTALFTNLIPGEYNVTEKGNDAYIPVTIATQTVSSGQTTQVSVDNIPKTGSLEITKVVDKGSAEGWSFDVKRVVNGSTVYDQTFTTDANGKINVSGLQLGEYTVTELETSTKTGYYCTSTNPQSVTIMWNGAINYTPAKVLFENVMRRYTIYKVDAYNYPLKGVEFGVYTSLNDAHADQNRVTTLVTDGSGYAIFEGFGKLHYYIKETKTLDGYQLSAQVFEINNTDGSWVNTTKGYDVKIVNYSAAINTGIKSISDGVGAIAVVGCVGLVGYAFYKRRKKKDQS